MNKNYLFFIFSITFLFACTTKELKQVDKSAVDKIVTTEQVRYMVYLDENIKQLKEKSQKDSAEIFIGALFNNPLKGDQSYNKIQSYKRWDVYKKFPGKNGIMKLYDFNKAYEVQKSEAVTWNYSPTLKIDIAPFVWNNISMDIASKSSINQLPIEHWAYHWLSPIDSANSIEKTNNIHKCRFDSPTDTVRVNVDFGAANKEAFFDLIDSIQASGANFISIKTYTNE